jgi:hypothetical protein
MALETRLRDHSFGSGVNLDRLRRRVVFERVLVRLEAAGAGRWVLKGGMALEVRWEDRARATRDLDLAIRDDVADATALRSLMAAALDVDPHGDWFQFETSAPRPLAADEAGRTGWRVPVAARLAGRRFAEVRIDVVARVDELASTERIVLSNALEFAGLDAAEIEAVDANQHFAEKLHALTRTYVERPNSRVRDLPDLLMLIADGLEPTPELLAVVQHVFAVRGTHQVPIDLPDPPGEWFARYSALAAELDIEARTLDAAMAELRAVWAQANAAEDG